MEKIREFIVIIPVMLILFLLLGGFFYAASDKAKRRKKIRNKEILQEDFGDGVAEFVYSLGQWNVCPKTPITITLFDTTYPIHFSFAAQTPADGITENHYDSYNNCMSIIAEKRKEIEEIIEKYCTEKHKLTDKQVLLSELKINAIEINKLGQYVLWGEGPNNCGDDSFALIFMPSLDIMTHINY